MARRPIGRRNRALAQQAEAAAAAQESPVKEVKPVAKKPAKKKAPKKDQ